MNQQTASNKHAEWVERACRYIEEHLEEELTLAVLGEEVALSPAHLQRLFKRVLGISPRQYADACRLKKLKKNLKRRKTVTTAMYEAGYGSSSRLYERSSGQLGMTPATYQRGGKGMSIRYTFGKCPLGLLLLAGTERGICAVSLGDDKEYLEKALREEYPAANIAKDDGSLKPWLDVLLEHLKGEHTSLDLPLDVQATAFQRRVWQELCRIPYGTTTTYSDIAKAIGQPTAARAVARACATNPVSLVIPCHRVIREDGDLGGYRWGLERKEKLLKREQEEKS